ncbi:hypothetical protein [Carboxylicivirga taeanensis]|uniref:hypothetical protein n=1 Tax=Carboxylicivirga taeanensis TaxID=1416875 RepID=UPI003F6DD596
MMNLLQYISGRLVVFALLLMNTFYTEAQAYDINQVSPLTANVEEDDDSVAARDSMTCKKRWYLPQQYKLQYAGSIGFMSVGFGYEVSPTYQPVLFIGYLSEKFGGSKNRVLSISVKNSFYFTRQPVFKYLKPYAGLSINWGNTNNTFKSLPDYYPDEYYFQNMIHFAPFVGGEFYVPLKGKHIEGVGLYTEVSAFDAYLLEAIRTKYVKPHMALSLALGITIYIN